MIARDKILQVFADLKLKGKWDGNEFRADLPSDFDKPGLLKKIEAELKIKGMQSKHDEENSRLIIKHAGETHEISHKPGRLSYFRR